MASACCRSTFAASWGELFPKESERLLCLLALSSFVTASIKIFLPSIRLVPSLFSKLFTKRCEKLWQRSKVDEQRKRKRGKERRTVWRRIHEKSRTWNPVYRVVDTRVFKWWRGTLTFFFSTLAPRWSLRYEWTLIKGHRERGSLRAHGNLSCLAPFSYPLLALRKKLGRYKFDSTTLQWNAKKKKEIFTYIPKYSYILIDIRFIGVQCVFQVLCSITKERLQESSIRLIYSNIG